MQYVGYRVSSGEDHARESYADITGYELFATSGAPVSGGVYDLRIGTLDHKHPCTTCGHGKKLCPGHRGSVRLHAAVLQPIAVPEVRRWLRVVCLKCGELLVERDRYAALPAARRLAEAAAAATEGRRCPRCAAVHPKIIKDEEDHFTLWAEPSAGDGGAGAREKLYPDHILTIFERVSDAAVEAMGRSVADAHPRRLALRVIEVPPNTIRPGIKSFGGSGNSSYHDSTAILQNVIKRNGLLPEWSAAAPPDEAQDRALQSLQQLYFELIMGSSGASATQGNSGKRAILMGSRSATSFLRRLTGKPGRIRANLLGKRVFYISRSTISGNMRLHVDEVGVPVEFARTLQVKETVQEFNREWLMGFYINGRRQYPGCTLVVRRATGEVHDVAGLHARHGAEAGLEIGDALYRDVVNGDLAYFNRAPTLERSSIGVHRVVVILDATVHTFQMNVLACAWYNADFDGDQMNLWVARGPAARAEARIMSGVSNWFISTKTSGPVNGQVQDSTVGCYELTRSAVRMDKIHAMAMFTSTDTPPPRFDLHPAGHRYSGRDVASLLFALTPVNYSGTPSSYSDVFAPFVRYDPDETYTVMEQGRLLRGVLDKRAIGADTSGGIFHLIGREYDASRALTMIFALQQVALRFLATVGFTVGTADLLPSADALAQIHALTAGVELEAQLITERLLRGEVVAPIDSTVHSFYESMQLNALKVNDSEVLRWVLGSIRPESNGFYRMVSVGSKGKTPNLIHVAGVIGQTEINGARIAEQFAFRRTLPYFPRFATTPAAYGFVANNYMTGMTVPEFMFQNMKGRVDLISKALSTAIAGFFTRKGVMSNQSAIVDNYRHVVKDSQIVQMLYGEDGLDSRELELVRFRTVSMDDAALAELGAPGAAAAAAVAALRADRDEYRRIFTRIEGANFGQLFTVSQLMPVNVARIVESVFVAARAAEGDAGAPAEGEGLGRSPSQALGADKRQQKVTPEGEGRGAPAESKALDARIARVDDLCDRLPYTLINEIQERRRTPVPAHLRAATWLLTVLVRAELPPAVLARLTDAQLTYVIDAVRQRYARSLVDYGSAVGILAAQSISEPLTQYMLDSHHRSVGGGSGSGINRVGEIYGARGVAEEQSAAMQLPLRRGLGAPAAAEAAKALELVLVRQFVTRYDLLLEPPDALLCPQFADDAGWLAAFGRAHPLIRPPADLTNWCVRLVIDKTALVYKAVELELIVRRLRAAHPGLHVAHTPESVPVVVVRAWMRASMFRRGAADPLSGAAAAEAATMAALDTAVRGIAGILHAVVEKVTRTRVGAGGALEREERLVVRTAGTNLYHAMMHADVDAPAAISTSIGDTYRMFGIEAARAKIISETRSFMETSTPNLRHLYLYADEMTRTGAVTSIERGGLSMREPANVLLRMAYGDPIKIVTDAALGSVKNKVYGIAAPQMLGSVPQVGTLYNSLTVDEDFVRANVASVDNVLNEL